MYKAKTIIASILMGIMISAAAVVAALAWQTNEIPLYQDGQNEIGSGVTITGGSISGASMGITKASGSFTRAANATGTQSLSVSFIPQIMFYACKDDSVASQNSFGIEDNATIGGSANNSLSLLSTLIAGPSATNFTDGIYVSSLSGNGWSGHTTTFASTSIITFSKLGSGAAITCKWWAIK